MTKEVRLYNGEKTASSITRIWRTGQTRKPIFYILQCIGSIDIRIERTQLDKGHDAQELLNPVMDDDD